MSWYFNVVNSIRSPMATPGESTSQVRRELYPALSQGKHSAIRDTRHATPCVSCGGLSVSDLKKHDEASHTSPDLSKPSRESALLTFRSAAEHLLSAGANPQARKGIMSHTSLHDGGCLQKVSSSEANDLSRLRKLQRNPYRDRLR